MNYPEFEPEDFDASTFEPSDFELNEDAFPKMFYRVFIASPTLGDQFAIRTTEEATNKQDAIIDALDAMPESVVEAMVDEPTDSLIICAVKMFDDSQDSEQKADKALSITFKHDDNS